MIGLLVGFVVILLALVVWEFYQGDYAMLVPRLISKRSLWSVSTFQFFFAGSYFLLLYYLPIYFQRIKGANPIMSGVDNLPMVITAGFFVPGGDITIAKTGHAVPFMAAGAALATVGMGCLYTLGVDTPSRHTIFQILRGAFGVSAAQSTFVNRLISTLPSKALGVNPELVVATDAAELRSVFGPEQLPGVILA